MISSSEWLSAMGAIYRMSAEQCSAGVSFCSDFAQVPQLPRDLFVDVERRLSPRQPAVVAGDHQLADLDPQQIVLAPLLIRPGRRVVLGVERQQAFPLGLDVDRLLPAAGLP